MYILLTNGGVKLKIQGVVLAGGHSRRFGRPKAFAKKDGIPFFEYSIRALEKHCQSLVIVTNPHIKEQFEKAIVNETIQIINDEIEFRGQGPLSGIYTAMEHCPAEWYMVSPIDVPFIQPNIFEILLRHISDQYEVIVPIVCEKIQPLLALYHYSLKEEMKRNLQMNQNSLIEFLVNQRMKYIFIECDHYFININSQEDYKKFIQAN